MNRPYTRYVFTYQGEHGEIRIPNDENIHGFTYCGAGIGAFSRFFKERGMEDNKSRRDYMNKLVGIRKAAIW